jgi:predicted AlkP superfamily pyrophosphatase or phosphodiesterase
VIDGLRNDTAAAQMGYMEHLVEHGQAQRNIVIAEMPSMSRPLYETIQTGLPPYMHGVVNNNIVRRSTAPNVFEIARAHGRVTAAAAYWWVSELYNAVPYDPAAHGDVDEPNNTIQHGRFYMSDSFPDLELFLQAERMVRRYEPDYLLVHPMGMDNTGHQFGAHSREYNNHAIAVDQILASLIPGWLERQYNILVTADHGMNENHMHGGSGADVRQVPLYTILSSASAPPAPTEARGPVSQLCIAPTVLKLLGLPVPETMQAPALVD